MSDSACDARSGHCVTCGDEGIPMRVLELRDSAAVCVDEVGGRHGAIAVDLVEPVTAGDQLLVHAGVAIGRL